jgi:superoxide dismutase, Fe-Mn family
MAELVAKPLREASLSMQGISRKTMEEHYKLYEGYIKKSNEILGKLGAVDAASANQIYSEARALKVELSFALNGARNHELYFGHLGGDGELGEGELKSQIEKDFGSIDQWKVDLKASGMAARGWVWLCWDVGLDRLIHYIGDTQNTYLVWGATPILGLDIYEHAYYLDFGTARADYIDAFLGCIDWSVVEDSFENSVK